MPASPTFALQSTRTAIADLPAGAYLVHATNGLGVWGAGFAKELAGRFPAACAVYRDFCRDRRKTTATTAAAATDTPQSGPRDALVGRCLVIPPQDADVARGAPAIYIVCLFTSYGYGRPNTRTRKPGVDAPVRIRAQTAEALAAFRAALASTDGGDAAVVYSPRFNSGAFKVPWAQTAQRIEAAFAGWTGQWLVMEPPE